MTRESWEPDPNPDCRRCGRQTAIDFSQIGKYRCIACGHTFVETIAEAVLRIYGEDAPEAAAAAEAAPKASPDQSWSQMRLAL